MRKLILTAMTGHLIQQDLPQPGDQLLFAGTAKVLET
jgi:hypothetical protein